MPSQFKLFTAHCTAHYLRWKELAHGIVNPFALGVLVLPVLCEVLHHLLPVIPELVVEDPVSDTHAGEGGDKVEALPESKLLVVPVILATPPVFDKVLSNFSRA